MKVTQSCPKCTTKYHSCNLQKAILCLNRDLTIYLEYDKYLKDVKYLEYVKYFECVKYLEIKSFKLPILIII